MGSQGDLLFLRSHRRPPSADGPKLRIVDLFSGCGGMSLGASEAARSFGLSAEIVLAMELREQIRTVYDANFVTSIAERRGDVAERFDGEIGARPTLAERSTVCELGDIDLLVGGPPCQGHSNLNNHTRRKDPKNALYLRMIRAVEVIRPRAVIVENVPSVRRDQNDVVGRAMARLDELDYKVLEAIVPAVRLGIPQLRTRHFLLAVSGGRPLTPEQLSAIEHPGVRDLRWAIGDLVDEPATSIFESASNLSPANARRARYLLRSDKYDLPNWLRPPCHRDKPDHKYKSMYGRLAWNLPAQTITTGFGSPGQGRYLHPERPRTITPHEAARIQFFPDWFDFSASRRRGILAECIGNAVPSKLAFCLTRVVLAASTPELVAGNELPAQAGAAGVQLAF